MTSKTQRRFRANFSTHVLGFIGDVHPARAPVIVENFDLKDIQAQSLNVSFLMTFWH